MIALTELKTAVYSALIELGLNVSDGLPINEKLPYIQIGELTFSPGMTKTDFGGGYELTLHFWCDAYDDLYFHEMIDFTCETLIGEGISLPTCILGDAKITLMTTLKDDLEGHPINHGVLQIEFQIIS